LITAPLVAAEAQDATHGVPGDWLSRYSSARSIGLGSAYVAAADEPIGTVWNPAALSFMDQLQLRAETARLFESTSINAIGFAIPSSRLPSLGLTVLSLSSGDIERTSETNESLGTFSEGDMAFLLTASQSFGPRLAVGANFKVVRQTVEDFGGTGFGADLGVVYEIMPDVKLGASLLNVGGPGITLRDDKETYGTELRTGASWRFLNGKALLSTELDSRSGPGASLHSGAEFWFHERMAVRVGYSDVSPAGGVSFVPSEGFRFDYGVSDHELGVTHRIGVSYAFGGFFAKSVANPRVFSPIGERAVTKFHLQAKTKSETERWELVVVDKSDNVVRSFSGRGAPPAHIVWDGKDATGLPLPDGTYSYQLSVQDADGREVIAERQQVEISTSGPSGAVPAVVG
jgi:hypothetical protein